MKPTVDVDGVAEGLEGVEADAERKDDAPSRRRDFEPQVVEERDGVVGEEEQVFEVEEQAEVDREAQQEEQSPAQSVRARRDADSRCVVHQGGHEQQGQELHAPEAVEGEASRGRSATGAGDAEGASRAPPRREGRGGR